MGMSFQHIVKVYQKPLYWYIRRLVLVHEDAEDILQETFLKAYRHLWMLRSENSLKTWLFRIATNEVNRYFKKRKTAESETIEQLCIGIEQKDGMIESQAPSEGQVGEVLHSAMLRMSPLQRQVFNLRYYHEMDYDQISRITGASKNTLMVSYHEACKKIEKEANR